MDTPLSTTPPDQTPQAPIEEKLAPTILSRLSYYTIVVFFAVVELLLPVLLATTAALFFSSSKEATFWTFLILGVGLTRFAFLPFFVFSLIIALLLSPLYRKLIDATSPFYIIFLKTFSLLFIIPNLIFYTPIFINYSKAVDKIEPAKNVSLDFSNPVPIVSSKVYPPVVLFSNDSYVVFSENLGPENFHEEIFVYTFTATSGNLIQISNFNNIGIGGVGLPGRFLVDKDTVYWIEHEQLMAYHVFERRTEKLIDDIKLIFGIHDNDIFFLRNVDTPMKDGGISTVSKNFIYNLTTKETRGDQRFERTDTIIISGDYLCYTEIDSSLNRTIIRESFTSQKKDFLKIEGGVNFGVSSPILECNDVYVAYHYLDTKGHHLLVYDFNKKEEIFNVIIGGNNLTSVIDHTLFDDTLYYSVGDILDKNSGTALKYYSVNLLTGESKEIDSLPNAEMKLFEIYTEKDEKNKYSLFLKRRALQ